MDTLENFQEAAPMTKLLNLKTRDQMEVENFSEFNDPIGISDYAPMEEPFQDVIDKFEDDLKESATKPQDNKDNHTSSFENSTQKIGYKTCDICDIQYNSMQFEFHTSKCKKYFHHFVEANVDSNLYQCKICQQNYRRTGLLYKHLEKSHDQIIAEILLDNQIQDDFGEEVNDDTTDEMVQNMEEESQNNLEDMVDNKGQLSSIQDENSIPKIGYKRCKICSLQYSMGEQFENHSVQCETYFHLVEVDTEMSIYKCKFCRSLYRRTGLLYKHMEKVHGKELSSLVNGRQAKTTDDFSQDINEQSMETEILLQNNVIKTEKNDESLNMTNASSSDDLDKSEWKTNLKPCPICNVPYLSGKNHKQHVAACSKYFHLVIPNALGSYQCKFCKSTYRKTGLLYRHFEKHHSKILSQIVQDQDIKEENAATFDEFKQEESIDLKEHIGPGSKNGKKICYICNTERETKKIERHVKRCLKYFEFVQKSDENSDEYTCMVCEKSGFDPIGRLYYHLEAKHGFPQKLKLLSINKQPTKKEERTQLKQASTTFECKFCKKNFTSKSALNGHMQMHSHKGIKNSVDNERQNVKENSINIRPSSIPMEKYTIPTGIELIPIPMKKNKGNFQDSTSNVNKQLMKPKQMAYNDQIGEVEQPSYDDEVLRECYFCTMCDEDDDADEAFKSYKSGEIRNHIVSNHSFSIKMQHKEKFEIRCFLKTDIELQEFEDVADESELHICTMCDKNQTEAFKSVSASAVRKHAVEIHSYSLKMQKKYKSTIRCIQIPMSKQYAMKKEM